MIEDLDAYKGAYDKSFKFYDENQWYLAQYAKYLTKTVKIRSIKSILSLGIGHQVVSDAIIASLGKELDCYSVVEGSKEIIDAFLSKHKTKKIELFHAYFENFDTDKTYDAIEMGFVLEHVDDPKLVINRFKKFLKEDGTMFISVPNAKSLHRLIGHKAGLLDDMYKLSPQDMQLGHKRYFDLDILCDLVDSCNMKVTTKKGLMLKPVTGQQIQTLKWNDAIIESLMDIGEDYPEISNCIYIEVSK